MRLCLILLLLLAFGSLHAQCPGGYASKTNIISNGDFSYGNSNFKSDYSSCSTSYCLGAMQGLYAVGTDASTYAYYFNGKDHTTGSGNFMIVNGDNNSAKAWYQSVRVKPRTNYVFTFYISTLYLYTKGKVQINIDGKNIGSAIDGPSDVNSWEKHEVVWFSGTKSVVDVAILNVNSGTFWGSDYGLDDIGMVECLCNNPAYAGKDTSICAGDSAQLVANSGGNTYYWLPVTDLGCQTCQNTYVKPKLSTTYFVTVNDTSGCYSSDAVYVNVNKVPKPVINGDSIICGGKTATLKATMAGASYLWNTGAQDSFITVSDTGVYWVRVNVKGCFGFDSFTVKKANPVFDLGKDTALCDGETIQLFANANADSIIWQDSSMGSYFTVNNAGKYYATAFKLGCSFTDTINISYKQIPVVELGNTVKRCYGDAAVLDAGILADSYIWSTGDTSKQISVYTPGKYKVYATVNGCTGSDSVQVFFQPPIYVDLGNDTSLCEGEQLPVYANTGMWSNAYYSWHDGSADEVFVATKPGKYWVTVKYGECTASDTIQVFYKPNPKPNLGTDKTVCEDVTVTLDAGIFADTYIWNTGDTTRTILVDKPGKYIVTTYLQGCVGSDTIMVNHLPLPRFNLGKDTVLCEGQNLLLEAKIKNVKYQWQNGWINPYFTVLAPGGTYWVKVDNGSCTYTDTINVNFYSYPVFDLGKDTILCPGQTLTLNPSVENAQYFWSDSSTANTLDITEPGKYWVKIHRAQCSTSDTIQVKYKDLPKVNLGKDTILCRLKNWNLNAGNSEAEFLWSTGDKSRSINVNKSGAYWVQANLCGNIVSDTVNLTFLTYSPNELYLPNAFTPNKDSLNDEIKFIGIENANTFEWKIFNRWGQLVFSTDDLGKGWNGTFEGKPAAEGIYYWKMDLRSTCMEPMDISRTGIIHLIR